MSKALMTKRLEALVGKSVGVFGSFPALSVCVCGHDELHAFTSDTSGRQYQVSGVFFPVAAVASIDNEAIPLIRFKKITS